MPGAFIADPFADQPDVMPLTPVPPPRRGSNAGPPPAHDGEANWIEVAARGDGTLTVTNSRNGFSKTCAA